METQNLVANPKSEPGKSNSKQCANFYLSIFPAKINDQIFKTNKKNPIL